MSANVRLLALWLAAMVVLLPLGYAMALAGEPRAHWFWCSLLGAC